MQIMEDNVDQFNVNECNREPAVAVNTADRDNGKELFVLPGISEVKEYGRKNNLTYSVPRYVGLNHYYICTCYKRKGKPDQWTTQINPLILSTEGLVFVEETQHGVEGTYLVPRHPRILVAYTEAGTFNPIQRELIGLAALQFQQAVHAANGMFISDFGLRIDDNKEYQEADDEGKAKIADEYFKALKESMDEELDKDKETKDYVQASKFLAEKVEVDNARQGVLPADIERKLNEEADSVDGEN